MLVNGFDSANGKETEVIDVSGRSCPKPAAFPVDWITGTFGAYLGARVVVCGGLIDANPQDLSKDCYELTLDDDDDGEAGDADGGRGQWKKMASPTLTAKKGEAVAVKIEDEAVWFTGGIAFLTFNFEF